MLWPATVIGVCLLTALVATWPLSASLGAAVPLGTEREATVPVFNLWTLWWTADRAAHGFRDYWNAPVFHPVRGSFTFSEPQLLTGLLVAPLWAVGTPPALIYNVAVLALLALNGCFAYRLARAVGVVRLPALLAGVLTVALPFIAKLYGVLPIIPLFGILWVLEGLVQFGRYGSPQQAAFAAVGFVVQFLSSQQLALLFAPFAVAAAVIALAEQRFQPRAVGWLVATSLVAGGVVLLVAQPALQVHTDFGFQRSERIVQALSARPGDFLTRPATALVPIPPREPLDTGGLFPGLILSVLAFTGAVGGLRSPAQRRWTGYLIGSAVLAGLLALGLNLRLGPWQPFATLRAIAPGFSTLRSPFRFAAITQLCLPILAAIGLDRASRLFPERGGRWATVFLGLLGALENLSVSAPLIALPSTPGTAWTAWVRTHDERAVIAHVPFPAGLHVSDYEREAWRMFAQIHHRKPIVNGYSGYFPPGYTRFQLEMAREFPNANLLCGLNKRLGVNRLVIDQAWLARNEMRMEAYRLLLEPIYDDKEVKIYRLEPADDQCHSSEERPEPKRITPDRQIPSG